MSRHSPENTARRLAAMRQAAAQPGYASWSTGPRTVAGKRRVARNSETHGAESLAVQYARAYADVIHNKLQAGSSGAIKR